MEDLAVPHPRLIWFHVKDGFSDPLKTICFCWSSDVVETISLSEMRLIRVSCWQLREFSLSEPSDSWHQMVNQLQLALLSRSRQPTASPSNSINVVYLDLISKLPTVCDIKCKTLRKQIHRYLSLSFQQHSWCRAENGRDEPWKV